ncbi:MAG TPA: sigma-54 dependent transcriptional regulator [Anaerolineales bacterium]|jgi:DNA-binding NtrC family response regulator
MPFTILIVDDEAKARGSMGRLLSAAGYEILEADSLARAVATLQDHLPDILLLDFNLPDGHGLDLLRKLSGTKPRPQVVVVTGTANIPTAVEALQLGAADLLEKPVDMARLKAVVQRATEVVRLQRELDYYQQSARAEAVDWVMGETPAMQQVLREARRAAATSMPVLVTGQTGTGKDVLARAIHMMGPRASKPFIPVNCAALPAEVIESELFGHEAGAFTDASKRKPGVVEAADGGVLFLDEIGTLRLDLQAKLLRFLDDHTFRRVGGISELTTDVQVVAASNRDLPALVEAGQFREDLYYRLKVADLRMPTLAERKEDIPALVGLFVRKYNQRTGTSLSGVTPHALQALVDHPWPGNIRELRYVVERAAMMCEGEEIDLCDLPVEFSAPQVPIESETAKPAVKKKK